MSEMQTFNLPDAPDPAIVSKWTGIIRAWIPILAMFGIAVPNLPDAKLQAYVSALLMFIGIVVSIWSWMEKTFKATKTKEMVVDSAVASAKSGVPVVVTVTQQTPPGQPNVGVATPVAYADIGTATVAPSPPGTTADDLNRSQGAAR